jgi:hypothetical protein
MLVLAEEVLTQFPKRLNSMFERLVTVSTAMQTRKMASGKRQSSGLESDRVVHSLWQNDISGGIEASHAGLEPHTLEVTHEFWDEADI